MREGENRALLLTKIPLLDRPGGSGISRGTLVELCGGRSGGHWAVALAVLAAATGGGESAALIDPGDHLDPEGAAAAGIDLSRLLWVRPARLKEALMSAEMILSTGFSLVVLDLAMQPIETLSSTAWMRLSRAAQAQGSVLLVVSSAPLCGTAADMTVAVRSSRPVWLGSGRAPRLLAGLSVDLTARKRRGARREISGTLFLPAREGMIDEWSADRLPLRS